MNGDSFFKQLKQLARMVDRGLHDVTDEVENNYSKRGPAAAVKKVVDLKSDVKEMKCKGEELLYTLESEGKEFDKILKISTQYLEIHRQKIKKTEEYFAKYGYQKKVLEVKPTEEEKVETPVEEEENQSNEDQITAAEKRKTPKKEKSPSEGPRTPKPEDFGLSSLTLSACKRPEKTQVLTSHRKTPKKENVPAGAPQEEPLPGPRTPKPEDFGLSSLVLSACKRQDKGQVFSYPDTTSQRSKLDSVPDIFQHDGIQVTPSFLGGKHASPGWKQDFADKKFLVPKVKDGALRMRGKENFDQSNSPAPRFGTMNVRIGKELSDITGIHRLPNTPELTLPRNYSAFRPPPDTPELASTKTQLNSRPLPDTPELASTNTHFRSRPLPDTPELASTNASNHTPETPVFLKKYKATEDSHTSGAWKPPIMPQEPQNQSHTEALKEMPQMPKLKGLYSYLSNVN
ncbi:spindle and kinetochore-associated protein 3-like [Saccostrea echinata]|uniref:spindle and kinetochore-associated protein 3-like n=1 Tax=Saccostrea echinata TaxID=191078 RepID=UPI002A822752|nr:spindle and kinetochore-associated protein 3-like [Saccostrea echinata]